MSIAVTDRKLGKLADYMGRELSDDEIASFHRDVAFLGLDQDDDPGWVLYLAQEVTRIKRRRDLEDLEAAHMQFISEMTGAREGFRQDTRENLEALFAAKASAVASIQAEAETAAKRVSDMAAATLGPRLEQVGTDIDKTREEIIASRVRLIEKTDDIASNVKNTVKYGVERLAKDITETCETTGTKSLAVARKVQAELMKGAADFRDAAPSHWALVFYTIVLVVAGICMSIVFRLVW
ncbi:hypothetical protein [Bradyrhizobium elkanii]|uniref:hypothetical protein n=1 Tax=Bradyrhizobium elkanii TaxID=29448 RepID=UPI003512596D